MAADSKCVKTEFMSEDYSLYTCSILAVLAAKLDQLVHPPSLKDVLNILELSEEATDKKCQTVMTIKYNNNEMCNVYI